MAQYRTKQDGIQAEQVADWTQIRTRTHIDQAPPGSFIITDAEGWQEWVREDEFGARYELVQAANADDASAHPVTFMPDGPGSENPAAHPEPEAHLSGADAASVRNDHAAATPIAAAPSPDRTPDALAEAGQDVAAQAALAVATAAEAQVAGSLPVVPPADVARDEQAAAPDEQAQAVAQDEPQTAEAQAEKSHDDEAKLDA